MMITKYWYPRGLFVGVCVCLTCNLLIARIDGQENLLSNSAEPVPVASNEPSTADDSVDFHQSILPILQSRCFQCHSQSKAEGDLRLDSATAIQQGGHSGNVILAATADDSELYRRIASTEKGYRMPKQEPLLDDDQIELFRRWIERGASWPESHRVVAKNNSIIEYLGEQLVHFDHAMTKSHWRYVSYLAWPFGIWLIVSLASYPARKRARKNLDVSQPSWLARFGLWGQLLSLLGLVLLGVILFQFGSIEELTAKNIQMAAQLEKLQRHFEVSLDPHQLTMPPYPMHLRRLGGVYYRGNDERSPELFNGGFYRTATMEVWLEDEQGKRLAWGDGLPSGSMYVSLVIDRAAGTTSALFSDDVMHATFLRHFQQSEVVQEPATDSATEVRLVELEPAQRWTAKVPVEPVSNWKNGMGEGIVYLLYGDQMVDGHRGRVHFGIKYKIHVVDGIITDDSELWMGSMYDLGGRVLIPQAGEVLLDQWFDFRPIPEIEGENSTDPELLGIPEYVPSQ